MAGLNFIYVLDHPWHFSFLISESFWVEMCDREICVTEAGFKFPWNNVIRWWTNDSYYISMKVVLILAADSQIGLVPPWKYLGHNPKKIFQSSLWIPMIILWDGKIKICWVTNATLAPHNKGQWWKFELLDTSATSKASSGILNCLLSH